MPIPYLLQKETGKQQQVRTVVCCRKAERIILVHLYDSDSNPIGMQYRTTSMVADDFYTYWFEKNLQGDIIGVYTAKGLKVCSYAYDAWGKFKVITDSDSGVTSESMQIAGYNPFRYRGYYYDQELGMYYLQSRYYDPVICRFINADGQLNGGLLGYNQYAYCENNPVMYIDPFGNSINWNKFVQGALLFTVGALTVAAVIATGGTCAPWVAVGYAVLGTSGVVAAGIGASEMVEGVTESNPMTEYLGAGMYNALTAISLTIISFGPMILEYGNAYGNVCFVEGTLIATENGNIPIEEIEAGMLVYAHDPETGETALKPVVQTFRNEATELVHITVDGEEIICTNEHPFYSPVKGWTAACRLRTGDILVTVNGEYVVIEKVQHELLESPTTVYNFEVEGFHTYFVGDTKVLVHNECQKRVAGDKNGYNAKVSVGGEPKHRPHAHIFWKNEKIASVEISGKITGVLNKAGRAFVKENWDKIVIGITEWWYYGKGN